MNEGPAVPKPVTFEFAGQTPVEAAAELRKFGKVKVVPEDGTLRPVKLDLKEASMDKAVAQLAKWVGRKWAKFYAIEPRGGKGNSRPPSRTSVSLVSEAVLARYAVSSGSGTAPRIGSRVRGLGFVRCGETRAPADMAMSAASEADKRMLPPSIVCGMACEARARERGQSHARERRSRQRNKTGRRARARTGVF